MASLQSKIQVVMHPPLPATCCVCHKSANGIVRFLDFQMDLDYYGAVVMCEDCAKEMLTVLDYTPVAALESAEAEKYLLTATLTESRIENERLRYALDSILVVRPDLQSNDSPLFDMDSTSDAEANRQADTTESGLIEPDSKWGPEGVSQPKF